MDSLVVVAKAGDKEEEHERNTSTRSPDSPTASPVQNTFSDLDFSPATTATINSSSMSSTLQALAASVASSPILNLFSKFISNQNFATTPLTNSNDETPNPSILAQSIEYYNRMRLFNSSLSTSTTSNFNGQWPPNSAVLAALAATQQQPSAKLADQLKHSSGVASNAMSKLSPAIPLSTTASALPTSLHPALHELFLSQNALNPSALPAALAAFSKVTAANNNKRQLSATTSSSLDKQDPNHATSTENAFNSKHLIMVPRPRHVQLSASDAIQRNEISNSELGSSANADSIAVLVFCATRKLAIHNHLEQLLRQRPDPTGFPIYVSQDSNSEQVRRVVAEFVNKSQNVQHLRYERYPAKTESQQSAKNYFYIAQHYKWALTEVFKKHSAVIITEDDLDIADDFFNYFAATRRILDEDPSVFCISAWNDNGASGVVDQKRSNLMYRTDFFPGLGWMLKAEVGKQLLENWPDAYWDDWLRKPDIRQNRVCIRPEIPRTAHNNRLAGKGSSNGMYKSYLANIQLPAGVVDFSLVDMSRLYKRQYDANFRQKLLDAKPINADNLIKDASTLSSIHSYRVTYATPCQFRKVADKFKLMNDFRSGMARTAYYGVVAFMAGNTRVYIVPERLNLTRDFYDYESDEVYDLKWDLMNRFLDFQAIYCRPGKWLGPCDPKDSGMQAWFERSRMKKRLEAWGEMIVC